MSVTPGMVLAINKLIFNDHISKNNIFWYVTEHLRCYLVFKGDFTNIETLKNLNQGEWVQRLIGLFIVLFLG